MTLIRTWARRMITIPLFFFTLFLTTTLMPLLIPFALIVDLPRKNGFAATRAFLFLFIYLLCECLGIGGSFLVWLASGKALGIGQERFLSWNYRLQRWWAKTLFRSATSLFNLRLVIDGERNIRGPLILFVRHASLPDVILPSALFIIPRGMKIRHVMKKELLWDPCLDIVGHRIPNVFVERKGENSEQEIRKVRALMAGLKEDEGVMIYPEGTRFTDAKRQRILLKLEENGELERLAQARQFENVLPPRLGGAMALLEENKAARAVFCAHVGFERVKKAADFFSGALIGAEIRVLLWSIPFAGIPTVPQDRVAWFLENWKQVDRWVGSERER